MARLTKKEIPGLAAKYRVLEEAIQAAALAGRENRPYENNDLPNNWVVRNDLSDDEDGGDVEVTSPLEYLEMTRMLLAHWRYAIRIKERTANVIEIRGLRKQYGRKRF